MFSKLFIIWGSRVFFSFWFFVFLLEYFILLVYLEINHNKDFEKNSKFCIYFLIYYIIYQTRYNLSKLIFYFQILTNKQKGINTSLQMSIQEIIYWDNTIILISWKRLLSHEKKKKRIVSLSKMIEQKRDMIT